ncbi:MAG: type I secretion system permease/ATPase [Burkholderiales bacterium]|jgi:PrtD family type I secretion system ABC transporter|nr:type I secretion system permease/ATPase [Burkholderiales bacterium]
MREFLARFRPFFVYAALFSLVMNLLMLVPALFMLQVYDRVITSRSVETLVMLLVVTVGALLFMAYLDMIRARLLSSSAVALEKLLGPRVLADMVRRGIVPGARDSLYGLRDVGALRTFLTGPGIVALFDAPWVPIYLVVIALFHPLLGAIALAGAIALLAIAWLTEKMSRKPLEATQLEARKAGRFAEQSIANAEVAGALGMIDNLRAGWEKLSRRGLKHQLEASRSTSALSSLSRFLRQFLQTIILATGAWLVIEQQATSGVMIAAAILMGRALAPIEQAIAGWKSLVEARAAYGRLDKALAAAPAAAATELPAPTGALSVERVVFGFRGQERPIIKGVSFDLAPGDVLAIVGPSAAGKSTLARIIVGVWPPASGVVRLDGADIAKWPHERLGPHIGYLPQNVELFAGTVSENIARMGEIDSEAVIRAAQRANAHDMILHLAHGYDTPIGEGGSFLSAGQRQRVALARALYGNPKLIVLDEPNSNLDNDGETALIEAVRELKAENVTVIVITHRTTLLAVADKVMVLREGAVEKLGPINEVLGPMRPHGKSAPATILTGSVTAKG